MCLEQHWSFSFLFPPGISCFRVKCDTASSIIQSLRSSEWLDLKIKNPKHNLYFSWHQWWYLFSSKFQQRLRGEKILKSGLFRCYPSPAHRQAKVWRPTLHSPDWVPTRRCGDSTIQPWSSKTHSSTGTDDSWGPTAQHTELYSASCDKPSQKRIWKGMDTCICIKESLCHVPETHTTL